MRISRLAVLPLVLAAAGCIQGKRVIRVNADGSGTIEDTIQAGEQMKGMMGAMRAAGEAEKGDEKAKKAAALKAKAAQMGEGVSFVSLEETDLGEKVVFAFKDIGKARIGPTPGFSTEEGQSQKSEEPLTFRFERKGGSSVLTVITPQPKKEEAPPEAKEAAAMGQAMAEGMAEGMWGMMKGMMKGLKLTTTLEVNGKLLKANSPYSAGSSVTLFEMDFDQIAADEANWKKFTKAGADPESLDPAKLQGVKGVKVSPSPETVIEFAGK